MGNKISNAEVIEDLKVEMTDGEKLILKGAVMNMAGDMEITRMNARRILAHAMMDAYQFVPYEHELVKGYLRQIVKKYLNGSRTSDDESLACKELIDMVMEVEA
jgi:hypothetical protein